MQILRGITQIPHPFFRLSQTIQAFIFRKRKIQTGMAQLPVKNPIRRFYPALHAVRRLYLFQLCILIHDSAESVEFLHVFAFPFPLTRKEGSVLSFIPNGAALFRNNKPQCCSLKEDLILSFLVVPQALCLPGSGQIRILRSLLFPKLAILRIGDAHDRLRLRPDTDEPRFRMQEQDISLALSLRDSSFFAKLRLHHFHILPIFP